MRRAPIEATTSWRLPGAPATDGISKRTAPASADTTRAAAPPTVTVTPSAKPAPARITSSPGQGAGRVERGGLERQERDEGRGARPAGAGLDDQRTRRRPGTRGGTFTCSVPPDTDAAGTDRSPNHTTLSRASLSNRFPVTVTVCPGSAAAGATESTWGAVKKSRFVTQ